MATGTNFASKYSNLVDEAFALGSLTNAGVNQNYDWSGVKTVNVFSYPTTAFTNYNPATGYGAATAVQNNVQELTVSQDKGVSLYLDRLFMESTEGTATEAKTFAEQLRVEAIPMVDIYRLSVMGTTTNTGTGAITKANAYAAFLDGQTALTNAKVPVIGRVAFISATFYKFIKQDDSFIKASDIAQTKLINGQIGSIDGVALIQVPDSYIPGVSFIITHPSATPAPIKLADYQIYDRVAGKSGAQVDMRLVFDAFILDNKKNAIYAHKLA